MITVRTKKVSIFRYDLHISDGENVTMQSSYMSARDVYIYLVGVTTGFVLSGKEYQIITFIPEKKIPKILRRIRGIIIR